MINLDSKTRLAFNSKLLKNFKSKYSAEKGFSLLESLMAVAVVSVLIVGIAPMVAVSTSARVNARRVDQATQAGKSYIEAVRGKVFDTSKFPVSLRVDTKTQAQGQYILEEVGVPTTANFPIPTGCFLNIADATQNNIDNGRVPGVCVDANGDGFRIDDPQDLVVQPMRSGGTDLATLNDQGFWLSVRVYRADAFGSGTPLKKGTEPECGGSKLVFVSTQGSKVCPLVTMRSQIILSLNLTDNKTGTGSSN